MLIFKNQKTTTIRFLITAIKTKTTHTSSLKYIFQKTWFHTNSKIKLIEKTSNRIIINGKTLFKDNTKDWRKLQEQYQGLKIQKTTTIRFLITAIKTKTTHTSSLMYIFPTTWFLTNANIKLTEKTSNRIIFNGKTLFKDNTKDWRKLQ